ncbi:hypothetical protein DICA3_C09714 [Diutina catenulata]
MIRTLLRSFAKPKPTLTIFAQSNCASTTQLYSKLNLHCNNNYQIETRTDALKGRDLQFLLDECVDVHPENKSIIHALVGKRASEELCASDFTKAAQQPLVIDWQNRLVATDCKSFDRILANYNGCGMQNFGATANHESPVFDHNLVHPNCAEFADLF